MKCELSDIDKLTEDEIKTQLTGCRELVLDGNIDELKKVLKLAPATVTLLNIEFNELGDKTVDEVVELFSLIPPTVTSLDMGYNNFSNKTGEELARIFSSIPPDVTLLKLTGNELGKLKAKDLAKALGAIHKGIRSLDLNYNKFEQRTDEDLEVVFEAISKSVTSLDLSANSLGDRERDKLSKILLDHLPGKLQSLKAGYKEFTFSKDRELPDVEKQLGFLREQITSLSTRAKKENAQGTHTKATLAAQELHDYIDNLYGRYSFAKMDDLQFKVLATYVLGDEKETKQVYKQLNYDVDKNGDFLVGQVKVMADHQRANVALLKKHRGPKEIIINLLAACLLTFVYAAASVYSKATKGHWTVFKPATKTGGISDELLKDIDNTKIESPKK